MRFSELPYFSLARVPAAGKPETLSRGQITAVTRSRHGTGLLLNEPFCVCRRTRKGARLLRALIVALLLAGTVATSASAKVLYRWAEVGAGDTSSVRAVTDGACPNVVFDGISVAMMTRADPATRFENVKPA